VISDAILLSMRISETQVDEFIDLYKQEYGVILEKADALEELNALIFLVSRMFPDPIKLE
jgi:hypothetical protein